MENQKKKKIPKHILKKKQKRTINLNQRYKKIQKFRERERVLTILWGENMDWMRKMISNLYKIKWGEEESKYKKEKESVTVSKEQQGDKETKRKEND